MTDALLPPPTDLKDEMEEMRAAMAREGKNRGAAGALQAVLLKFLDLLIRMLADFRAGKLAPPAPAGETRGGCRSGRSSQPSGRARRELNHTSPRPSDQVRGRLSPQSGEGEVKRSNARSARSARGTAPARMRQTAQLLVCLPAGHAR